MIETLGNLDATKQKTGGQVSKLDPGSMPGFATGPKPGFKPGDFRIKYKRVNVQSEEELIELEAIETRAIRDEGVYVISKERFVFMDQILILIQYMEKIVET